MKKIVCFLAVILCAQSLFSESGFSLNDPDLLMLLDSQKQNSEAYLANEAFLETGKLQYNITRSILYPQINLNLSGSGANSFLNRIPSNTDGADDIELRGSYSFAVSPELSISQLLPSSGTLSGKISEAISASGLEESNNPLQPAQEAEYSNQIAFSLNVAQPLFLQNAYKAGLNQMNETLALQKITYIDNRNQLIISAASDYYNFFTAGYNMKLVESRLEINRKYEQKILREHELGLWTDSQVNSAAAARLQAEADLLKAERAFHAAQEKIKNIYGLVLVSGSSILELDMFNSGIDPDAKLPEALIKQNPQNLISLSRTKIAEAEVIINAKNSAPAINLGSSYTINSGITDEGAFSDSLAFSLGVSIPVTDGGYKKNSLLLKKTEAQKIGKEAEEHKNNLIFNLRNLFNDIEIGMKLDEIYLLQEKTAASETEKGLRELELGQITQKQLLDLQANLENIRLTIVLNRIEQNLNILNLYRLLGYDLDDAIQGI